MLADNSQTNKMNRTRSIHLPNTENDSEIYFLNLLAECMVSDTFLPKNFFTPVEPPPILEALMDDVPGAARRPRSSGPVDDVI